MYSDQADWTLIGEVKRNPRMTIPIIGNGDITSAEGALEAFERYGVDGIMVGRATFGRPWIFKEIVDKIQTNRPSGSALLDWKMDILKEQVETSVARLGEFSGVRHVRRHLANSPLFKGIPDFRQTRIRMLRAETVDELFEIMEQTRTLLKTINEN